MSKPPGSWLYAAQLSWHPSAISITSHRRKPDTKPTSACLHFLPLPPSLPTGLFARGLHPVRAAGCAGRQKAAERAGRRHGGPPVPSCPRHSCWPRGHSGRAGWQRGKHILEPTGRQQHRPQRQPGQPAAEYRRRAARPWPWAGSRRRRGRGSLPRCPLCPAEHRPDQPAGRGSGFYGCCGGQHHQRPAKGERRGSKGSKRLAERIVLGVLPCPWPHPHACARACFIRRTHHSCVSCAAACPGILAALCPLLLMLHSARRPPQSQV